MVLPYHISLVKAWRLRMNLYLIVCGLCTSATSSTPFLHLQIADCAICPSRLPLTLSFSEIHAVDTLQALPVSDLHTHPDIITFQARILYSDSTNRVFAESSNFNLKLRGSNQSHQLKQDLLVLPGCSAKIASGLQSACGTVIFRR